MKIVVKKFRRTTWYFDYVRVNVFGCGMFETSLCLFLCTLPSIETNFKNLLDLRWIWLRKFCNVSDWSIRSESSSNLILSRKEIFCFIAEENQSELYLMVHGLSFASLEDAGDRSWVLGPRTAHWTEDKDMDGFSLTILALCLRAGIWFLFSSCCGSPHSC